MCLGNKHAVVNVLFRFNATRERHGLSLHTLEWTEFSYRVNAFVGVMDNRERPIGIVLKLFHGTTAAEASTARQFSCMVEEVAMSLEVCHTAVVGKRLCVFERHYRTHIFPWPFGFVAHRICDMLGHSASSIKQPVLAVAFCYPRTFGVAVLVFLALLPFFH